VSLQERGIHQRLVVTFEEWLVEFQQRPVVTYAVDGHAAAWHVEADEQVDRIHLEFDGGFESESDSDPAVFDGSSRSCVPALSVGKCRQFVSLSLNSVRVFLVCAVQCSRPFFPFLSF